MDGVAHHRAIWLSDVHLGSRGCRAGLLLDFLDHNSCDVLYLVGDIVDLESLRRSFYWPKIHTRVLERFLQMSREGTTIYYVPGNHDDDFRALAGTRIGTIEVRRNVIHTTANGRRLLVLHGDEFDSTLKCGLLAVLTAGVGYPFLLTLNRMSNAIHSVICRRPYWSLAQYVKLRIGKAVRYVNRFQDACLKAARERNLDGVICGHIHKADVAERDGLIYCNDGDWVESCTALVESQRGLLSIVFWPQLTNKHRSALPLRDAA